MEHSLPFRTKLTTALGRAILHGSKRNSRKVTQRYAQVTEPLARGSVRYFATGEIPDGEDDYYGWTMECIWVAGPYRSRVETYQIDTGDLIGVNIVNDEGWIQWGRAPHGGTFHHEGVFPLDPRGRRVEKYEFPHHTDETMMLIRPDWILHGYDADWQSATPVRFLDRPATQLTLDRMIPLADPRVMGDEDNPHVFDLGERVRMTIDDERFVILRAEGLYDGEPWQTMEYTELAFDELLDDRLFDLTIQPDFSVVLPAPGSSTSTLPADVVPSFRLPPDPPAEENLPPAPIAVLYAAGVEHEGTLDSARWLVRGQQVERSTSAERGSSPLFHLKSHDVTIVIAGHAAPTEATLFLDDKIEQKAGVPQAPRHLSFVRTGIAVADPGSQGWIIPRSETESALSFRLPEHERDFTLVLHVRWIPLPFEAQGAPFATVALQGATWEFRLATDEADQSAEEDTTR